MTSQYVFVKFAVEFGEVMVDHRYNSSLLR